MRFLLFSLLCAAFVFGCGSDSFFDATGQSFDATGQSCEDWPFIHELSGDWERHFNGNNDEHLTAELAIENAEGCLFSYRQSIRSNDTGRRLYLSEGLLVVEDAKATAGAIRLAISSKRLRYMDDEGARHTTKELIYKPSFAIVWGSTMRLWENQFVRRE